MEERETSVKEKREFFKNSGRIKSGKKKGRKFNRQKGSTRKNIERKFKKKLEREIV